MKRVLAGTFLAATFAVGLSAQSSTPPQPPSAQAAPAMEASKDAAKSITVTGCLKAGELADSFILSNLKWSDKAKATGAVGTSGSTTLPAAVATATTLKIIPGASTKLAEHVGHTVEVTGAVSDKDKSATPVDPASPHSLAPSVEVRTVKMVSDSCTPE